jgi:hypothetical protein
VDLRTVRTIRSAIEIRAPLETVWQVLTDFAAYPEWNPHIRLVRGKPGPNRRISIHSAPPGGRGIRFRPRITSWQPPNELRWKVAFLSPRLFTGERGFRLEVPREFRLKRDGKRLVMTTRDQQMVTTVTPTEPGPTDRVLDSLVDAVRAGYQDVEPGGRQLRRPDGRTIHVAVGKATISAGIQQPGGKDRPATGVHLGALICRPSAHNADLAKAHRSQFATVAVPVLTISRDREGEGCPTQITTLGKLQNVLPCGRAGHVQGEGKPLAVFRQAKGARTSTRKDAALVVVDKSQDIEAGSEGPGKRTGRDRFREVGNPRFRCEKGGIPFKAPPLCTKFKDRLAAFQGHDYSPLSTMVGRSSAKAKDWPWRTAVSTSCIARTRTRPREYAALSYGFASRSIPLQRPIRS